MRFRRLLGCLAALGAAAPTQAADGPDRPADLTIFHSADLRGELEPCGCAKTPVGGFARRSTALREFRAANPDRPLLLVDSGSWFLGEKEGFLYTELYYAAKGRHLLELFRALGYEAVNLGGWDLLHEPALLSQLLADRPLAVLSANASPVGAGEGLYAQPAPYRVVERGGLKIALVGLTDAYPREAARSGYEIRPPLDAFQALRPRLEVESDFIVVLAQLSDAWENEIARALGHGGVVIGRFQAAPSPESPPNRLQATSNQGQVLERADLWLDGERRWERIVRQGRELNDTVAPDEAIVALRAEFNRRLESIATVPIDNTKPYVRRYAGAKKCGTCHEAQGGWWRSTAHAEAVATLRQVHAEFNPECVRCHVTGFGEKHGFLRYDKKPDLAGVQCESCHGDEASMVHGVFTPAQWAARDIPPRGSNYTEAEWKELRSLMERRQMAANRQAFLAGLGEQCRSCHDETHSPDFDFQAYLARVRCPLGLPDPIVSEEVP